MTEVGVGRVSQGPKELIVGCHNDRAGLLGEGARQRSRKSLPSCSIGGVRPRLVQHLLGQASIQLSLDRYSHWMSSIGRNTAVRMDEALG